jgi:hypothetical protein
MAEAVVVRGRFDGGVFVPSEPLPAVSGPAELIVFPEPTEPVSIFDLFGKAPTLRSADDIAAQLREERDSWGEP